MQEFCSVVLLSLWS